MSSRWISIDFVIIMLFLGVVIISNIKMIHGIRKTTKLLDIYYTENFKTEFDKKKYLEKISKSGDVPVIVIVLAIIVIFIFQSAILFLILLYILPITQLGQLIFFHRYDRKSSYSVNITQEKNTEILNMTKRDLIFKLTLNKYHVLGVIIIIITILFYLKIKPTLEYASFISIQSIVIAMLVITYLFLGNKMIKDFLK